MLKGLKSAEEADPTFNKTFNIIVAFSMPENTLKIYTVN